MDLTYGLTPDRVVKLKAQALDPKKKFSDKRKAQIAKLPDDGRKITVAVSWLDQSTDELIDVIGDSHAKQALLIGIKRKFEAFTRTLLEEGKSDTKIQEEINEYIPEFGARKSSQSTRQKLAKELVGKTAEELQQELEEIAALVAEMQSQVDSPEED